MKTKRIYPRISRITRIKSFATEKKEEREKRLKNKSKKIKSKKEKEKEKEKANSQHSIPMYIGIEQGSEKQKLKMLA